MKRGLRMFVAIVGVDLAKIVFHVHTVDRRCEMVFRSSFNRDAWVN